jgi:Integrase core domain
VVQGSVRKAGNQVRINAQLIEGATDRHVWADRYDRDLTDIFAIQDEITKTIVEQVKVKLLPEERKAIEQAPTADVGAYTHYLRGRQFFHRATRHEALEPIRQAVRGAFGAIGQGVAARLSIRHDHGSQYMSGDFQKALRFLGATSSPAFVRAPEGNGCAERFIRTLKENLLWVRWFETIKDLRQALLDFQRTYNEEWIIQRHGYRTPAQVRREQTTIMQTAA